jgi:phage shock protein PspC (stress-responsive transcriptional regulator)
MKSLTVPSVLISLSVVGVVTFFTILVGTPAYIVWMIFHPREALDTLEQLFGR